MENATPHDSPDTLAPVSSDADDGKDEMNFAEFPLAAIADRVPDDQKTLVFEDQIFDSGRSEMISRRLTITASEKYGLPTSLDDEVILGLSLELPSALRRRDWNREDLRLSFRLALRGLDRHAGRSRRSAFQR
jgi:hypothetical protein